MAGTTWLINPRNVETSLSAIKDHWEIHYSRFVNYPKTPTSLALRPLSTSTRIRNRGSWFSSSSTASLHLLIDQCVPEPILVVSLRGKTHEEHFISNLHFSWPQVSCLAQCPIRGSRVVFASYRDCVGQIQKFAMRFLTSGESQTFIDSLKDSLKGVRNVGLPISDFGSEISSQSEFITSNGVHYRTDEELGNVNPVGNHTPLMQPSLNHNVVQYACSEETILAHDFGGTCATLPPSFTALLTECCTEAEQEPPKVPERVELESQLVRCMTDSSFHDMLSKLEKVINEMGGDLAL